MCHRECHTFLVLRKNGLELLVECSRFEDITACTKKYCDLVKKKSLRVSADNTNVNVAKNKDGTNGPNTPESIILD